MTNNLKTRINIPRQAIVNKNIKDQKQQVFRPTVEALIYFLVCDSDQRFQEMTSVAVRQVRGKQPG